MNYWTNSIKYFQKFKLYANLNLIDSVESANVINLLNLKRE